MGQTHWAEDAPLVEAIRGLIGELTDDEVALVRTLTLSELPRAATADHLVDLVDLLTTIREDGAMAEYVYAIAPNWDGTVETLLLAARVTTAFTRYELERRTPAPAS